jgi:hypothetical protein
MVVTKGMTEGKTQRIKRSAGVLIIATREVIRIRSAMEMVIPVITWTKNFTLQRVKVMSTPRVTVTIKMI